MTPIDVPAGFRPVSAFAPTDFIAVNGPLYLRHEVVDGLTQVQVGFRVEPRHCNPMGDCHGGMMATFCDMLLPLSIHRKHRDIGLRFLPTVSLQIDYMAPARLGAWVQGEAEVLRVTRRLVFSQGIVTADGTPAVRVSAIFKIGQPFAAPAELIG